MGLQSDTFNAFSRRGLGNIGAGRGEWVPEAYKYIPKDKRTSPPPHKLYCVVAASILMALLVVRLLFVLLKPSAEDWEANSLTGLDKDGFVLFFIPSIGTLATLP